MKKKLLFIMQSLQGGGAERVTIDVIKHLDKNLFEPTILVVNHFGELTTSVPENIKVIPILPEGKKSYMHLCKVLRAIVKATKQVDLIVGALEMTPTYLAAFASIMTKKPAIGWVHVDVKQYPKTNNKVHQIFIRTFYKKLKAIIAVSNGAKKSFEDMFPEVTVPVKRIYNPIRTDEIERLILEQDDLPDQREPIILGIGRLSEVKGFDDLIRAHKYLLNKNIPNKLVILGEGELRPSLEKLIYELKVKESVILKGFVKNPYKYLRTASVFVLSSRYEGFSIVVAEALAVGVPIVSTDCPSGPAEILENGKYGILSPLNDYRALAKNIMKTLKNEATDNQKNMRIERAKDFSLKKIIPEYEKLFDMVVHKEKSSI